MLDALRSIMQRVGAATNAKEAVDIIVSKVHEAMQSDVCSIYLLDDTSDRFVFMATEGLNKSAEGKVSLAAGQGLVGLVASRAEPLNLDQAHLHKAFKLLPDVNEDPFNSFLGAPIMHNGKVLGVLVVQQQASRKFEESEESFLITVAAQLAGLIAHATAVGALSFDDKSSPQEDIVYQGLSAANGLAIAKTLMISEFADIHQIPDRKCEDIEQEVHFFYRCLKRVKEDINVLKQKFTGQVSLQELALFDVYLSVLDDAVLGDEVVKLIKKGSWAQGALSQVVSKHIRRFEEMDDDYLRERAVDIKDLGLRVLGYLQESEQKQRHFDAPVILMGDELTPSVLAEVPREYLAGLISVKGSVHSHLAILARSMDVPIILGVNSLPIKKIDGSEVILDAYQAQVIVQPSDVLRQRYQVVFDEEQLSSRGLEQFKTLPAETTDGKSIDLMVNTGLLVDAVQSQDLGIQGVGLYRSEVPFLMRDRFPSEQEQRDIYRQQLESFHPQMVTMRTLDVGGDKALSYFPIEEENPALGWRGVRISLDHTDIFLVQIRAMLKASVGLNNLKILLPMISHVKEFDEAYELIRQAYIELNTDGMDIKMPQVGIMVEVPSSIYLLRDFKHRIDFLSVGSNDLTQYLLAVDRNNANVSKHYSHYHPAVLRACYDIATQAKSFGLPLNICGEMAGEPMAAVLLLAMGYDGLSMSGNNILKVKALIRFTTSSLASKLLDAALKLESAHDIEDYLYRNLSELSITPLMKPKIH